MKVVGSEAFNRVYAGDPAARAGRLEAAVRALKGWAHWVEAVPASEDALLRCHGPSHLGWVRREGVFETAALAAGGAIQAAEVGRAEPAFALVRPPGHHASRNRAWGFCYFNNLAVALTHLRAAGLVRHALVLDVDLHFGDGTVDILGPEEWVTIVNPDRPGQEAFLRQVYNSLEGFEGDWVAVSAGFDNHEADWGGLLRTEDYRVMGVDVGTRTRALGAGCFAVLEGGYNPAALAEAMQAFLQGIDEGWTGRGSGRPDRL